MTIRQSFMHGFRKGRVLAWVNQQRRSMGLKGLKALPRGYRLSSCDCPIAKAVDGPACMDFVVVAGERVEPPAHVAQFIADFDHGKYPELIA